MQGRKLRILMNSEATYTYSGFGTYYNEVLKRLAATGKYELAELASYGFVNDPRDKDCKWTVYANCIKDDDPRINVYRSKPTFQWGEWRLDRTLLDFKADVLMSIRDPWMLEFEKDSPFRRFFHLVWMPTVDSAPQAESWIDAFIQADGIFTYSDWALEVLKHEGNGQIKTQRSAPPGVNLNIFCPIKDKRQHRLNMHMDPDAYIIGSVMRNQRRKLYPDMFIAFQKFLETADPEIANKTYLLIHTSYPDAGWSIPNLLKLNKVGHRILFSYVCRTCGNWFASHFQDVVATCPHCGNNNAGCPNVQAGVSQEILANIYKCMDVYVQYSICEGFGMPHAEAAACGIPTMGMPYSATEDILKYTDGIPLKIAKAYLEPETQAYRMMPDNDDLCAQWIKFFSMPQAMRQRLGFNARKGCEIHYDWDRTAKIWENYFDSIVLTGEQGQWDTSPYLQYNIPETLPENMKNASAKDFVDWLYNDILHRPDLTTTFAYMRLCSEIESGLTIEGMGARPINREMVYNIYRDRAKNCMIAEQARCNMIQLPQEDYIEYAHIKTRALALKYGEII